MTYDYATERKRLLSDEGQKMLLDVWDKANVLLPASGAVRLDKLIAGLAGDSFMMLACVERLVEIGRLIEVTDPTAVRTQYRVFISPRGLE